MKINVIFLSIRTFKAKDTEYKIGKFIDRDSLEPFGMFLNQKTSTILKGRKELDNLVLELDYYISHKGQINLVLENIS